MNKRALTLPDKHMRLHNTYKLSTVYFLLLSMYACAPRLSPNISSKRLYELRADTTVKTNDFLSVYRNKLKEQMGEVIGYTDTTLVKSKPDGNLGHFVCDAMLSQARKYYPQTAAAVCNYGGIRVPSVGKGNITLGTVFEVMPFDNQLVVLSVSGDLLDTMCQHIASNGGTPVSGISFKIKNNRAVDIAIANEALDHEQDYFIAVNDYMANGGDNMSYLKNLPQLSCKMLLRDAIINHIKEQTKANKSLWQMPYKRIVNQ